MSPTINLQCGDCLSLLKELERASVDCIITDPPYGENIGKMGFATNIHGGVTLRNDYRGLADWDSYSPTQEYFAEIQRVSRVQVIFGGNFFADKLPISRGWFVWDKKNGGQFSNDFADCELAWTNQDSPARLIRHTWHGMIQQSMKNKEERFHPTQKPVAVMMRVLELYTEEGDTVLDPYMGSGSTGVACMLLKRNFIGYEVSPVHFAIAEKRIHEATLQMPLAMPTL